LKRVRIDAARLKAAAGRGLKSEPPKPRPRAAPSPPPAGLDSLYPGLPGAALKAAVEASLEGTTPSEYGLTRYAAYMALTDRLAGHDGLTKRCLSISGSRRLAKILGFRAAKVVEAAYPEHTMLALGFADATFDACVSDQVLEHVEGNPFDAVRETFRVAKPGGFVVHTTCQLNPVHREPGDFWRFTPDALALLCRAAGGEVIETGSWGNRQALALTQVGIRSAKVPLDEDHPLHRIAVANDPTWPIHTWVIARKPA
jgi:SAM-dependent methyltransferase